MTFICYPKCSTCKKVRESLLAQGVELYRSLGLAKRLPEMSEDEQYALLASDGMLVKRPILLTDDGRVLVGQTAFGSSGLCPALR